MEVKINQFSSERKSEKQQAPAPNAVDFSMCSRVHLRKSGPVDFLEKMTIRQLFQTWHSKYDYQGSASGTGSPGSRSLGPGNLDRDASKNPGPEQRQTIFSSLTETVPVPCRPLILTAIEIFMKYSAFFFGKIIISYSFRLMGLKIRNSRLFLTPIFFNPDCRVSRIRSFDKF